MSDFAAPFSEDLEPLPDPRAAQAVLASYLRSTPTYASPALTRRLGRPAFLKLELFTPIRTFKIRGALTKIASLVEHGVHGPVITASGGNHGLAVAYAAHQFNLEAEVYVPAEVSPAKAEAIRDYGAHVIATGRDYAEAAQAARARVKASGLPYVHAFDDPDVIAGQGTVGLEILDQVGPADVYVPVGGGGLLSGVSLAMAQTGSRVFGVEMQGADAMIRSLGAGRVVELERVHTAADGLAPRAPSLRTLSLVKRYATDVYRLEEDALGEGIQFLLERERLWSEPSGAAAVAYLLRHPPLPSDRPVVAVVSGGNATRSQIDAIYPRP